MKTFFIIEGPYKVHEIEAENLEQAKSIINTMHEVADMFGADTEIVEHFDLSIERHDGKKLRAYTNATPATGSFVSLSGCGWDKIVAVVDRVHTNPLDTFVYVAIFNPMLGVNEVVEFPLTVE
jgi:hypothetical protein